MKPHKLRAWALAVVFATHACGQNVLIHDDSFTVGTVPQPAAAEQACINLGLPHTMTPDFATFDAMLTGGATWDLAIVQHVNLGGVPTVPQLDNLNTYLMGGGRVIFGSWQATATPGHPLFVNMECIPAAGTPAEPQFTWDGSTFITCGLASPQGLTDYIGFGVDTVTADAIPPGRALMGQATPAPAPGNGTVILAGHGRSLFVGFMPIIMDPAPAAGVQFMENAVQEILFGPLPIDDIISTGMTITPTPTVSPGASFDVDVDVTSTLPGGGPKVVTVDLFYGVGEPVPTLPGAGMLSQQVMVPAGGSTPAIFASIPAPPGPEVWRIHAAVNSDLAAIECDASNNVVSDVVCIADAGCTASCGDCNEGGGPVTILDALIGAQIAAGIIAPNPNQLCVCDVNASMTIDVIDALLMAQLSAGLPVVPTCGSAGGGFAMSLVAVSPGVDPVRMTFDTCGPFLDLTAEWSTDAGATWSLATAAAGSPIPNPSPGTPDSLNWGFWWDSRADVPVGARPIQADLRMSALEPMSGMTDEILILAIQLDPGPAIIPYIDPVVAGHVQDFTPGTDDAQSDVMLPFAFPYWDTPASTTTTAVVGFGTNGGLRLGGGYTQCCSQPPLWLYTGGAPTIHAHGADGYSGNMYSWSDPTMAVFSYESMDYCCVGAGAWSTQVTLLANGDFQIRQVQATTDAGRTITIGYSDGSAIDNSIPGATGIDWDAFPVSTPTPIGQVDFGSSEPGGMATGVVLYFQYDLVTGYTAWRLQ